MNQEAADEQGQAQSHSETETKDVTEVPPAPVDRYAVLTCWAMALSQG